MFIDRQQLMVKIFVIFTSIAQIASEPACKSKTVPQFFSGSDGSEISSIKLVKRETHDGLRYINLAMVICNDKYQELGNDTARVNQRYINIMNILNKIFKTSNVFIGLVKLDILRDDGDVKNLLKNISRDVYCDSECTFPTYDKNTNGTSMENNLTLLMSTHEMPLLFYYNSFKPNICKESNVIVRDPREKPEEFAATLIAEILLSLITGIWETDKCDNDDPSRWKNCAVQYLPLSAEKLDDFKCLNNRPTRVLNKDKALCGDGVIDKGEECDHGWLKTNENPCCDAKTCQLIGKATCGHGICCNLQTCNMHNTSTVCRPVQHKCDIAEYCDGESEYCPKDELINTDEWKLDKMNDPRTGTLLIIELALVIDSTILKTLHGKTSALNARYKEIVTLVKRLFQPLNISIALTHLEFWRNNVKLSNGKQQTYDTLQQYAQNLRKKGHVDNVQFIFYNSKFPDTRIFENITNSMYAFGTNSDSINDSLDKLVQDLAYNIARYLGVSENATTCPTFFCKLPSIPLAWCECVLQQISSIIKNRANLQCLFNKPSDSELYKGFDGPLCGNGLLETGEECDCGVREKCDIPCCDADRCRIRPDIPCPLSRG